MSWFTPPIVFSDGSTLTASDLNSTVNAINSGTVTVGAGGTGLTAGTSGGIPYFSSTSAMGTSGLLTQYGPLYGGGLGAAPSAVAAGTTGQFLGANTSAAPTWQTPTATVIRSYLAGLTLSNDSGTPNTVLDIAAGSATDGANGSTLTIAAFTKTTAAFAAGTGNGGLDTGAVANNTWYHVWLIGTAAGALTDILFSTSATAPTMPATYTLKRRIGAFKTASASTNILAFVQYGDFFGWTVAVLDVDSTNPGASAVTRTLTVPTGVQVDAVVNAYLEDNASASVVLLLTDLALTDTAPSISTAGLGQVSLDDNGVFAGQSSGQVRLRTTTAGQIRSRLSTSAASTKERLATQGWWDRRGRDD